MVDVDTNFDRIRRGVWVGPNAAKPYVEWNDLSRVLTDLLKWARSPEVNTFKQMCIIKLIHAIIQRQWWH